METGYLISDVVMDNQSQIQDKFTKDIGSMISHMDMDNAKQNKQEYMMDISFNHLKMEKVLKKC